MDWDKYLYSDNQEEKPLDRLVSGYSRTSVFRRIAFIGDSLSSGEFETINANGNKRYHDLYEYSWGQYIARKNGLTAYNFSCGGLTAKAYLEGFAAGRDLWNKDKACQAYVIAFGVNDLMNARMELGSTDDIDLLDYRNNKKTFAGYYGAIVSRYKEISPDAKFFFVTLPNDKIHGGGDVIPGAVRLLYDLAELFDNAYVIDLYKYGPEYNESFKKRFYLYGHLNPDGYIFTAELIDSYIDYIVRHNPDDFKNAGFIGSGIEYK